MRHLSNVKVVFVIDLGMEARTMVGTILLAMCVILTSVSALL